MARLQQAIENSLKSVKIFQGCITTDHEINVNDVILHEFQAVFGEHGTLVQPTSHNEPKLTVYIKKLSAGEMQVLFGVSTFKAELWTKGGPLHGGCGSHEPQDQRRSQRFLSQSRSQVLEQQRQTPLEVYLYQPLYQPIFQLLRWRLLLRHESGWCSILCAVRFVFHEMMRVLFEWGVDRSISHYITGI